MIVICLTRVTS